ncbi:MAG TPA: hypothetical protein VFR55_04250 [Dehalococcoidia bacterium]|nr:hypothetical protein [Dehalococcoidia bacterium]
MLCRHEELEVQMEPAEMMEVSPHYYLCNVCGNAWACALCGHPPSEASPAASPHLVAELEGIIAEHLERSDG